MDDASSYSYDIESRLVEYERRMLDAVQQVREEVKTLDERLTGYRTAQFLEKVSRIYPKTRSVAFICNSNRMFGNLKYSYLSFCAYAETRGIACTYVTNNQRQYEILRSANFPCLPHAQNDWTDADVKTLLSAQVILLDDLLIDPDWRNYVTRALVQGAKIILLWHGIPIKKIALDNLAGLTTTPWHAEVAAACGTYEVVVGANAASRKEWTRYFSFRNFAPIGYPRNDVLLRDLRENDHINVDCDLLHKVQDAARNGIPVILYAPTWRDYALSSWFQTLDLKQLVEYCRARNYMLCFNLHPIEQHSTRELRDCYSHIHFVEPYTDIYPIAKYADILISDYSSLIYDYLLLDRPIVFFRPDHTDYVEKSRQLIDAHQSYICGEIVNNILSLTYTIELAVEYRREPRADPFREKRLTLRSKLYDHYDAGASDRLNELIMTLLESPEQVSV